jgi:uncharacterized surface protein with fasciclin (FAS1) repeats
MKLPIRTILATSAMMFAINVSAKDIVETATSAGSFKTLVSAIQAAGKGPFTVFAPTDEAFAKLPPGTLDGLLKDKEKLSQILTYHVVPGSVMAKDVKPGDVPTANGKTLKVSAEGGRVKVDNANVTKTDIKADNGVIHVIDAVVIPK